MLETCFVFVTAVTPEGSTMILMVANKSLEKARAYLNQVLQERQLYIPS